MTTYHPPGHDYYEQGKRDYVGFMNSPQFAAYRHLAYKRPDLIMKLFLPVNCKHASEWLDGFTFKDGERVTLDPQDINE